jgi:hypothetical protein
MAEAFVLVNCLTPEPSIVMKELVIKLKAKISLFLLFYFSWLFSILSDISVVCLINSMSSSFNKAHRIDQLAPLEVPTRLIY